MDGQLHELKNLMTFIYLIKVIFDTFYDLLFYEHMMADSRVERSGIDILQS